MTEQHHPGGSADSFIDVRRAIADRLASALALSAQVNDVMAQAREIQGTAQTDDRSITAVVDHRGFVLDLRFTEQALDEGLDRLGPLVVRTVQDAAADARAQALRLRESLPAAPDAADDEALVARLETEGDALMDQALATIRKGRTA